jgi:hypothetical protein
VVVAASAAKDILALRRNEPITRLMSGVTAEFVTPIVGERPSEIAGRFERANGFEYRDEPQGALAALAPVVLEENEMIASLAAKGLHRSFGKSRHPITVAER